MKLTDNLHVVYVPVNVLESLDDNAFIALSRMSRDLTITSEPNTALIRVAGDGNCPTDMHVLGQWEKLPGATRR